MFINLAVFFMWNMSVIKLDGRCFKHFPPRFIPVGGESALPSALARALRQGITFKALACTLTYLSQFLHLGI